MPRRDWGEAARYQELEYQAEEGTQASDACCPFGISDTTGVVGVPTAGLLEPKSLEQKALEETGAPVAFLVNAEEH